MVFSWPIANIAADLWLTQLLDASQEVASLPVI